MNHELWKWFRNLGDLYFKLGILYIWGKIIEKIRIRMRMNSNKFWKIIAPLIWTSFSSSKSHRWCLVVFQIDPWWIKTIYINNRQILTTPFAFYLVPKILSAENYCPPKVMSVKFLSIYVRKPTVCRKYMHFDLYEKWRPKNKKLDSCEWHLPAYMRHPLYAPPPYAPRPICAKPYMRHAYATPISLNLGLSSQSVGRKYPAPKPSMDTPVHF